MAAKARFHVEIYRSRKLWPTQRPQRWRWRAVARNGKKIAHGGEGYTNKTDMFDAIELLFGSGVPVVEKD